MSVVAVHASISKSMTGPHALLFSPSHHPSRKKGDKRGLEIVKKLNIFYPIPSPITWTTSNYKLYVTGVQQQAITVHLSYKLMFIKFIIH